MNELAGFVGLAVIGSAAGVTAWWLADQGKKRWGWDLSPQAAEFTAWASRMLALITRR